MNFFKRKEKAMPQQQTPVRARAHDIRRPLVARTISSIPASKVSKEKAVSASEKALAKTHDAVDERKRTFLKAVGGVGLGVVAASILPRSAEALVMGGTPSTSVVGLKDDSDARINPATDDKLDELLSGQGVLKKTMVLSSSGTVHTPTSGKKIRVYANRFSLSADATSVSFRFTSGGTDYEKYSTPRAGGLYGANNHPNYVEGGVDEILYCVISGTTSIQINVDYLEITP